MPRDPEPQPRRRRILDRFEHPLERERAIRAYGITLAFVLATLLFGIASPEENWSRAIALLLASVTLMLVLWTTRVRRPLRRLISIFILGIVAVSILGLGADSTPAQDVIRVETFLIGVAAPVLIVRDLARYRSVTFRTVFGAVILYLLIGMLFGSAYGVLGSLETAPVFGPAIGDGTLSDRLYFSFTTMTTVGFGDITAQTRPARAIAVAEGLTGQLYLVTIVALVVSNLGRGRRPLRAEGEERAG